MSNGSNIIQNKEHYVPALRKHIPAGLLTVYLSATGIVEAIPLESAKIGVCWAVFGLCLIAVPLWMFFYDGNKSAVQIIFGAVSFMILVFTTGGPLAKHDFPADTITTVSVIAAVCAAIFTGVVAPLVAASTAGTNP